MIEIVDKFKCTGCGACLACCSVGAITLQEDEEGFRYPIVNQHICVKCNRCNYVCPMLSNDYGVPKENLNFEPSFYAAQLFNESDLFEVSSGGAFWAFAQTIINENGIVYGAVQKDVDNIVHMRADNIEDMKMMRRSKYFQSDIGENYRRAKEDLETGKLVLFSGTGCQIAGLNKFLGKSYNNLFSCDVVCHGVPSMAAWRSYRKEKENIENKRIVGLIFRDKSNGWSNNQYKIIYSDGTIEKERSTQQIFHAGYLQGLFYRPSCGCCKFSNIPRVSDITLADYWLYQGNLLKQKGDIGVSLIVVNNEHANILLEKSKRYLNIESTSRELALKSCRHLDEHPSQNPNRDSFFNMLKKEGYYTAAEKYVKIEKNSSLFKKAYNKINKILYRSKENGKQ